MALPQKIVTIERYILAQQQLYPGATGVLTNILYDMALAAKLIARETTRAGLGQILGATENRNTFGETQQKLDVFADEVIFKINDHTGRLCAMASEEHDDILPIPMHFDTGRYVLLYDPLDGSSNIDVNMPVGTIFSIHRKISKGAQGTIEDVLQPGNRLIAAGYIIYGPSTMMVYSTGHGVHGFTLEPSIGEFLLSNPDMRMPQKPKYYSVNQGLEKYWTPGVRRYVKWLQGIHGEGHEPLSQRYIGALIADFHRNLLHGGVFLYPADLKDSSKPGGKLRLMYEAQALAFIAEQAGGYASDGVGRILDIEPAGLHQRVPLFIGDRALVEKAEAFIHDYDRDWIEAYMAYRSGNMQHA
ncbi:MAG: class 1 fructose-bisphosphatase [Chloroflexi bacterium]|nr:class 1 fructose-bisphosphatase [Chloroflexota bacterium]